MRPILVDGKALPAGPRKVRPGRKRGAAEAARTQS